MRSKPAMIGSRLARQMRSAALVGVLALMSAPVLAQPGSPVGLWKNIDDETGKAKALIRIEEKAGALVGRIVEILTPGKANAVCGKCEGALKDKPVRGMQILQGLKKVEEWYEGGTILDPNNGKVYRSQLRLVDEGKRLEVRGFIGMPLFGRSQTWVRQP
ncbi:MAG: DUF2147 domain-containing protein [Burkholderiaceae bacterium]